MKSSRPGRARWLQAEPRARRRMVSQIWDCAAIIERSRNLNTFSNCNSSHKSQRPKQEYAAHALGSQWSVHHGDMNFRNRGAVFGHAPCLATKAAHSLGWLLTHSAGRFRATSVCGSQCAYKPLSRCRSLPARMAWLFLSSAATTSSYAAAKAAIPSTCNFSPI
jgi:hypothetical protein